MQFFRKYGFYLMITAVISEIVGPLVFGLFYQDYNHTTMLISSFGEDKSPVKLVFDWWQIIDGLLFIFAIPAFYQRFKGTSLWLTRGMCIMIFLYAVGDCIMTGIFSKTGHTELTTIDVIHNYASGIGFGAFLVGTIFLVCLYYLERKKEILFVLVLVLMLSIGSMFIYMLPNFPLNILDGSMSDTRGLWQRLNLIFLYLPFFLVAVGQYYQPKWLMNKSLF